MTVPTPSMSWTTIRIHQRVYIGNTTAPFFLTGIELMGDHANTVVASLPLPGSAEQPRFNPGRWADVPDHPKCGRCGGSIRMGSAGQEA